MADGCGLTVERYTCTGARRVTTVTDASSPRGSSCAYMYAEPPSATDCWLVSPIGSSVEPREVVAAIVYVDGAEPNTAMLYVHPAQ